MCGLLGAFDPEAAIDLGAFGRTLALLRHRGPDDEGVVAQLGSGGVSAFRGPDSVADLGLPALSGAPETARLALGFRRLAIQDISSAGHQPMASPDGRYWLLFNGELYDHFRLRPELERAGFGFRSASDTETLLAAWSHWGPACLDRLEGMWAFIVWDLAERKLHLVRDRFGIKPLHVAAFGRGHAFGSEIPPLLALTGARARAHPMSLFRYLRLGRTDDREATMFEGVRRIAPGHHATLDLVTGTWSDRAYWRLPDVVDDDPSPDAAAEVRDLFLASVSDHLLASVPVGVALSGGIDSSAILAGVRRARGPGADLHAFGHVADDPIIGEERWIDLAARDASAEVHKVRPSARDLGRDLESLVRLQGEPFGSTSIYAQYRVFGLARAQDVPVVLSGQGADEQLAGYRAYLGPRLASLLRRGAVGPAFRFYRAALRLPGSDRRGLLLRAGAALLPDALEPVARRMAGEQLMPHWLDAPWFRSRGVDPRAPRAAAAAGGRLRASLREAFLESSLPMLLRYEDRNSMAHSVESRVPFLQRALVERIARLPESALISDEAETKAIFRRAMRGIVPGAILDRRDKVGFATPEARWLAEMNPWVEAWLTGEEADAVQGLRPRDLWADWQEVRAGRRPFDARIWRGINAVAWTRAFDVGFD